MRMPLIVMTSLACSVAWAETTEEESKSIEALQIRLATIEQIDVTAEKSPAKSFEAADAEIDAILDEADALEADSE